VGWSFISPAKQSYSAQNRLKSNSMLGTDLTPVILATQEAEIRRIVVPSQPEQIVPWDPILKDPSHTKRLVEWVGVSALI
jgi:hypothetical protein